MLEQLSAEELLERGKRLVSEIEPRQWELAEICWILNVKKEIPQKEIGKRWGLTQSTISRYVAIHSNYALGHNFRPKWEFQEYFLLAKHDEETAKQIEEIAIEEDTTPTKVKRSGRVPGTIRRSGGVTKMPDLLPETRRAIDEEVPGLNEASDAARINTLLASALRKVCDAIRLQNEQPLTGRHIDEADRLGEEIIDKVEEFRHIINQVNIGDQAEAYLGSLED